MSLARLMLGQVECAARTNLRSVECDLLLEKEVEGHAGPVTVCHIGAEALRRWEAKTKRIEEEEEEETCGRGVRRGRRPTPNKSNRGRGRRPAPNEGAERGCRTRGASNADHAVCTAGHTIWAALTTPKKTVQGSKDDNLPKQAHTSATFGDNGRHIFGLGTRVGSRVLQDWRWPLVPSDPPEDNPGERFMTNCGQAPAALNPAPQIDGMGVAGCERLCNHDKKRQIAESTVRPIWGLEDSTPATQLRPDPIAP